MYIIDYIFFIGLGTYITEVQKDSGKHHKSYIIFKYLCELILYWLKCITIRLFKHMQKLDKIYPTKRH